MLSRSRDAATQQAYHRNAGPSVALRARWFSSRLLFFDVSSISPLPHQDHTPPAPAPPASLEREGAPETGLSDAAMDEFVGEKLFSAPRLACVYRQGAVHERGVLRVVDVVELANDFALGDWVRTARTARTARAHARACACVQRGRWGRESTRTQHTHAHAHARARAHTHTQQSRTRVRTKQTCVGFVQNNCSAYVT